MIRATFLIPLTLSALLAACSDPQAPVSPEDERFSQAVAPSGDPGHAATSSTIPLHFIRSNECADEDVEITGAIHFVSHPQPDGGLVGHFNYQGVTGIGLTSGTPYHASAVDHLRLEAPFPSSVHSVRSLRLVAPGPGNNLLVQVLYHITVTATGEVSVSIERLTAWCEGGPEGA